MDDLYSLESRILPIWRDIWYIREKYGDYTQELENSIDILKNKLKVDPSYNTVFLLVQTIYVLVESFHDDLLSILCQNINFLAQYKNPNFTLLKLELKIVLCVITHQNFEYDLILDELKNIQDLNAYLTSILFQYTWSCVMMTNNELSIKRLMDMLNSIDNWEFLTINKDTPGFEI